VSTDSVNKQCQQSVNDRFHQSIKLKQMSLFQYVSKQQVLTTVLYYNNFNIISIRH